MLIEATLPLAHPGNVVIGAAGTDLGHAVAPHAHDPRGVLVLHGRAVDGRAPHAAFVILALQLDPAAELIALCALFLCNLGENVARLTLAQRACIGVARLPHRGILCPLVDVHMDAARSSRRPDEAVMGLSCTRRDDTGSGIRPPHLHLEAPLCEAKTLPPARIRPQPKAAGRGPRQPRRLSRKQGRRFQLARANGDLI